MGENITNFQSYGRLSKRTKQLIEKFTSEEYKEDVTGYNLELKEKYCRLFRDRGAVDTLKELEQRKFETTLIGNLYFQDLINFLTTDEDVMFQKYLIDTVGAKQKLKLTVPTNGLVMKGAVSEYNRIVQKGGLEAAVFVIMLGTLLLNEY